MATIDPRSAAVPATGAHPEQGRRLSPQELHAHRVAWGDKWGNLVSNEVRRQLEERG